MKMKKVTVVTRQQRLQWLKGDTMVGVRVTMVERSRTARVQRGPTRVWVGDHVARRQSAATPKQGYFIFCFGISLLRGTIVNGAYGIHKNLHI